MAFAMVLIGFNWEKFPAVSRPLVGIVPGICTGLCLIRVVYLYVRKKRLEEIAKTRHEAGRTALKRRIEQCLDDLELEVIEEERLAAEEAARIKAEKKAKKKKKKK